MKIGYARVSTKDQNLALQKDALEKEGCERIFEEKVSGKKAQRPELQKLQEQLRDGDVIIIWKLDRLGRSLRDLVDLDNLEIADERIIKVADLMLVQYQYRREQFLKELSELLAALNIKATDLAA